MHTWGIITVIILVGAIIGLEYLIRHALMPAGPDQWKWDQWDWVTVGIAVFLGIVVALFIACKSSYVKPNSSAWLYRTSSPLELVSSPAYSSGDLLTPPSGATSTIITPPPPSSGFAGTEAPRIPTPTFSPPTSAAPPLTAPA